MTQTKVILLGLDGATFDLIDPWLERGELPNFARIVEESVKGELTSIFPPTSPGAWSSIVTGKNPGKHGLFDWRIRHNNSYDLIPVSAANRYGQALWDILSENGLKVGILNVPMTYPPAMVNGFMVSGMDTPSEAEVFTYPPDLYQEICTHCGQYVVDAWVETGEGAARERWLSRLRASLQSREAALNYLMEKYPWDFLMAVFVFPDRLQHVLWHCFDQRHPFYTPALANQCGEVLLEFYQMADKFLGGLVDRVDENTTLFVVSDHGFGPIHKLVFVNKFLQNLGLLKIKRDAPPPKIDWAHTKAYAFGYHGSIYINLRGREPEGTVMPGQQYEELREQIIEALRNLVDPETGKPIVSAIYKREEIYHGPYLVRAPDVLFQPIEEETPYRVFDGFNYIDNPDLPLIIADSALGTGAHRLNGIFLAWGKHIMPKQPLTGASVIDVAPTVLHLMGQPIPDDMDGRVLKEIFEPDFSTKPIEYVPGLAPEEEMGESVYSDDEVALITERLRGLGYV
jgi:predicted AlkP superfamily phosphohydrolase/phosphomutase